MEEQQVPLPHELTAEWTVRAHLTFARAGEPVQKELSAPEAVHPVRVVYKWCTPSEEVEEQDVDKTAATNITGTSFRSTNSSATTNADSAFGSPQASRAARTPVPAPAPAPSGATAQVCGTRCRSTCNIMVSAVADFLPQDAAIGAASNNEPFVYHSKVRAQQLRDAFSQTSDTEEQAPKRRPAYEQRRATTEALMNFASKRQAEEANTYVPPYSPTPTTPSSTFKSASMSRIPPLASQGSAAAAARPSNPGEKKPRTVHIDVYCTGSEEEEEEMADDERQASSSSSDSDLAGSKRYDLDSNSTPQTVLDNEQMLLRHQRISGGAMPRRLAQSPNTQSGSGSQNQQQKDQLNLGHAITKCSTAEEVSESKQLLFRKHIGDQRAAKLANLRQKYMRQPSDETSSSTYPNSSRSTMPRDATCSSISSVMGGGGGGDGMDSSWKETDEVDTPIISFGLTKSDSFDYENSLDRLRISQMERLWSRQHSLDQSPAHTHLGAPAPHPLQTITEVQSQRNSFQRSDTIPSESDGFSDGFNTYPGRQIQSHLQQNSHFPRNRPGFLQFFGPNNSGPSSGPTPPATAPVQPAAAATTDPFRLLHPSYRWKSEARDNLSVQVAASGSPSSERSSPQLLSAATTVLRCGSEAPPSTTSASTFGTTVAAPTPSPLPVRRFEISRDSPSLASETSTSLSGYTHEHLEKARRFGNVVASSRKPGHHVGPTKNPSCQCESCQRWMAERFQLRGRAFSLGEKPLLRRPKF
ncbi:uncharacterized protein [Drosophila kikkawai]|uniref:Flocculation protein FLO11 n=1 Tax=Drosophila kikkawai TaxID=30033 RepID=A0A6P4IV45_DROKI|nr:uncharacterized protein LOC108078141 [Drosophila kikkawai]XP_017027269.1 uncharacterized protein LOC108078141 [Drosophila kikkawai]